MRSIWKAIAIFSVSMVILTGAGFLAGSYVFGPWERTLSSSETYPATTSDKIKSGFDEKEYKKIKLAFSSFDLAAGLTRNDFEAIPHYNTYFFSFLWVCIGAIFILKKPRKRPRE